MIFAGGESDLEFEPAPAKETKKTASRKASTRTVRATRKPKN